MNFDKLTIELHFFSYIFNTYKISRKSNINSFIINNCLNFKFLWSKIMNKKFHKSNSKLHLIDMKFDLCVKNIKPLNQ